MITGSYDSASIGAFTERFPTAGIGGPLTRTREGCE
jgi:hypothetical protein